MVEPVPAYLLSEVEVMESSTHLATDPDIGGKPGTTPASAVSNSSDEAAEAASATPTAGGRHRSSFGSGPAVPDMTPTTENAYGGGLYGMDRDGSSGHDSATLGRASDFQSAEGLATDMPAHHVEHEPPSTGDRDLDITGQSYIQ